MTNKELFSLKGTIAVVTGGQGDLGSEYVKILVEAGAFVAVLDVKKEVHPKIQQLQNDGAQVLCVAVDLTKKSEVVRAFAEIKNTFKDAPTVLINNAGRATHPNAPKEESGLFEDYPEDVWREMNASHLTSALFVSQEFIRAYRNAKKQNGSIINISSVYGVVSPEQAMYDFKRKNGDIYYKPVGYSVAKSGMLGFTKWLAEYCGFEKTGIRVNTLVLGGVEAGQGAEFVNAYEKRTILGRMAQNTDYNGAVLFLASEASSYMTGASLTVDGGWTAR
ncbi:MAG: SDR family oxidoreductase [Candidatus Taylorbacteria bacterium]|nr:SDR family oxidoreductase [Candidatus Taylorbacteria bacterium]